jgi:methylenetetrahydrofolate dehydrogenase (NADP+)/methenyltetrahydrofolate cyclohydrolase
VLGRSSLVGLPVMHLLMKRNATVTVCNKMTPDINSLTEKADIVISATGVPNLVNRLKPDGVCIDIGISRDHNGKLCGDVSK